MKASIGEPTLSLAARSSEERETNACGLPLKETILHPRGEALGYFLSGYVPPGTPNWHPVLKKNSPKIDTPF